MRNFLDRLLRDQRGNVVITFAFAMPVVLGLAGFAVDLTWARSQESQLQQVVDATALASAKQLHIFRKNLDELKAFGRGRVEALLAQKGLKGRAHVADVQINPATNIIEVSLQIDANSFMPGQFWEKEPLRVTAQAQAFGQSRLCVLALEPAKSDAIKAEAEASLTAPDCAVQSNSANEDGIKVSPTSKITATVICTTGGYEGLLWSFSPNPTTDCPPLDDPLSGYEMPAAGGCDFLNTVIKNKKTAISPGTYCGGLKLEGTSEVTAAAGVYIFSTGKLELKDKAKLLGDNVSLVFADDDATLMFDKDTTVDLSAPKDGTMPGMLIYENPASKIGRAFEIKSENAHRLLGTIYLPKGKLKIDSKSKVAELSAYTVIVAREVEVKGANLVVNSDYGGTDVPVPEGVGPNSSMARLSR